MPYFFQCRKETLENMGGVFTIQKGSVLFHSPENDFHHVNEMLEDFVETSKKRIRF